MNPLVYFYNNIPKRNLGRDGQPRLNPWRGFYRTTQSAIRNYMKYGREVEYYRTNAAAKFFDITEPKSHLIRIPGVNFNNFTPEDIKERILEYNRIAHNASVYFLSTSFIHENETLRFFTIHLYKNTTIGYNKLREEDDGVWEYSLNPFLEFDNGIVHTIIRRFYEYHLDAPYLFPTQEIVYVGIEIRFWDLNQEYLTIRRDVSLWTGSDAESKLHILENIMRDMVRIYRSVHYGEVYVNPQGSHEMEYEGRDYAAYPPKITYTTREYVYIESDVNEAHPLPDTLYVKDIDFTFTYDVERSYLRDIFELPLPVLGGCARLDTIRPALKKRIEKFVESNTPIDDTTNSCFFFELFGDQAHVKKKELGYEKNQMLNISDALEILNNVKNDYIILHYVGDSFKIINRATTEEPLILLLCDNHYYRIKKKEYIDSIIKYRKCNNCYNYYDITNRNNMKHVLQTCNTKKRKRNQDVRYLGYMKPVKYEGNIYFADFETLTQPDGKLVVYAAGLADDKKNMKMFTGEDSLSQFVDHIKDLEGVLYFYNGSNFDNHFVVQEALIKNLQIKNTIYRGTQLMAFSLNNLKIRDMYLFTMCGLARACADFGVPEEYYKQSFDYNLIRTFEDVANHIEDIKHYLKYDLLALAHVFEKFRESFMEINNIDMVHFITLSHMAFNAWLSETSYKIALPNIHFDALIRRSYYGGRVFPQKIVYTSKDKDKQYDEVEDYCVDLDFVSLYPTAMRNYNYFYGEGVLVEERDEIEILKERIQGGDYTDWKMIICCDVEYVGTQLYTPLLPERLSNGSVVYNLKPKKLQSYVARELYFALSTGLYQLNKIHYVIKFNREADLFKDFIDKNMKIKNSSRKGTAPYQISKLTMNATYGKFAQKRFVTNKEVVTDLSSLDTKNVIGMKLIKREGKEIGAVVERLCKNREPTKPVYIAAQVTAHSRLICNEVLLKLKALTEPERVFHYSDTDSFVLPRSVLDYAKEENLVGKNLGMLDDELDGGKIIRAIYLAPKTYILEFIREDNQIYYKVRCKGIPHESGFIKKGDYSLTEKEAKKIIDSCDVKSRVYKLKRGNETLEYSKCITYEFFEKMLYDEDLYVECRFNSFKRTINLNMKDKNEQNESGIKFEKRFRSINSLSWWRDNDIRQMPENIEDISNPSQ